MNLDLTLFKDSTGACNHMSRKVITIISGNHLVEVAHRRKFERYARENGFDPLITSNWYIVPKDAIMSMKVSSTRIHSPLLIRSDRGQRPCSIPMGTVTQGL